MAEVGLVTTEMVSEVGLLLQECWERWDYYYKSVGKDGITAWCTKCVRNEINVTENLELIWITDLK